MVIQQSRSPRDTIRKFYTSLQVSIQKRRIDLISMNLFGLAVENETEFIDLSLDDFRGVALFQRELGGVPGGSQ